MIELRNISKTFVTPHGSIKAVHDIDIKINKGEIFGIIGHSGAGKSTLIRCINLLEVPTQGNVIVDGEDLTQLTPKSLNEKRKKIGMIFQHFNLLPSRTVFANIAFPLKDSKISKEDKAEKVKQLLELVGLTHRINAYPSELSGGEKQRVAIARALANDPTVLLCDEATSALDPGTTKSILNLLKEVNEKLSITIVLITHEMAVIKEICDRVALMEAGAVEEVGDVFDVFSAPKSDIAKEFVATTSSLSKVQELIEQESPIVALKEDEQLLMLTYTAENIKDMLLYDTSTRYNVKTNICFGNIELIKGKSLGNLVIIIRGNADDISAAITYLEENKVRVEVMKS